MVMKNQITRLSDLYSYITENRCDDMEVRLDDFIKLLQTERELCINVNGVDCFIQFTSQPETEPKFWFDENYASRYDWMKNKILLDHGNYGENTETFEIK